MRKKEFDVPEEWGEIVEENCNFPNCDCPHFMC